MVSPLKTSKENSRFETLVTGIDIMNLVWLLFRKILRNNRGSKLFETYHIQLTLCKQSNNSESTLIFK
ncbi:hypothetical protein FB2170_06075 [Maribacter sp. HTCC2170]|nr:hypothetical protein FB2170_06075 [Maribacter sp. HTCC2170]